MSEHLYCQTCSKTMSVNSLLAHVAGKTHKARLFYEPFDIKVSRSVIVRGISQNVTLENIQEIFAIFGRVESFLYSNKSKDSIIVRFFNAETTRKVLQASKNFFHRGRKLHISDELISLHDTPKCPSPPKISPQPEHSHPKDAASKFIEHKNMYPQGWKSNIPESDYKEARNVNRSIKPDLREKARKSELEERYQHFRKTLESEPRTVDPGREQIMHESHLRRPDHGPGNRFGNPVSDSYSRRNPNESTMDYRFHNTEAGRNYLLPDPQSHVSNHGQHVTLFNKSPDSDGREMVAESIGHLPTLSKYIPSFALRNAVGRDEAAAQTLFQRRSVDDRRSRDLNKSGDSSEFKQDLIVEYTRRNPDSRNHSPDRHYENLHRRSPDFHRGSPDIHRGSPDLHRSSPDWNRRSRSRDTGKRMRENQYQNRDMKRSSVERQDLKNSISGYRSRDHENNHNKKSYYQNANESSSKPDIQAHGSNSRMNKRESLRVSARECLSRTSSVSDRDADRDVLKRRRNSQIDDSREFVQMSKISMKFLASLDLKGDFNRQLSILMSEIKGYAFKSHKLRLMYEDIQRILKYDYEGCQIHPCGSAVTGMALPESQVHCYAELTEDDKKKLKLTSKKEDIMEMSARITSETLRLHRKLFSNVQAFISRKNPFIVFKHIPSGYYGNISFKGGFSVAQSELLNLFLSTDERLKPLFIFIRYWSTVNGVLVRNYFSKYCLSLLVIFYLQRLSKPILPPVQFLQDDPSYDVFEDGWNRGFNKTSRKIPKNENTADIMTLLEGFFEFYSTFAFDKFVISPFIGLALPSDVFQNLEALPLNFGNYVDRVKSNLVKPLRVNEVMNIQDPFQLNYNVSKFFTTHIKENFQAKCLESFLQFQKCHRNRAYEGLLNTILNINKKLTTEEKVFKIIVTLPVKRSGALSEECAMLIFVRLNKLLTDIVENVLKCKFTCLKDVKYNDKGSLLSPHVKYTCTAYYNLWSSRNIKKGSSISLSIDKEALASDKIINCLYRNQKPNCPILVFTLEASVNLQTKFIQLNMSCEDAYTETFQEFNDFIGPILEDSVRKLALHV